ncbi:hypothetical protein RHMOL_Rhmol11G0010100 [Rhododendron molle]|uniref:Uncharacterized protein n=1 Tax=Rhododendron molle TaxID=49168 RepID=A0ACC0LM95_RHOML|nr:hypothetical protein RHMOL_Rhmol11G0010100 [Rhododendron molle]
MEIYWADPSPFQAETNNVEADLYDENLWPLEMEDSESEEPISCNWAEYVFDDSPLTMMELGLADLKAALVKFDDTKAKVKDPIEEVN